MTSNGTVAEAPRDLEVRAKLYLERIEQIDRILQGPALTLVREATRAAERPNSAGFPVWLARDQVPGEGDNALTHSLCIVTVQRLYKAKRRFRFMKSKEAERMGVGKLRESLDKLSKQYLVERDESQPIKYFKDCLRMLDSKTFGLLNPFTGAQVFRVLMETGEDHAHTGIGCLAFFAMVWPLYRQSGSDPLNLGARIEPWLPSAYVTAKCILPLIELQNICTRRAQLFRELRAGAGELGKLRKSTRDSSLARWRFCAALEELRRNAGEMSEISISRASFNDAVDSIQVELDKILRSGEAFDSVYERVIEALGKALEGVKRESTRLLGDARVILEQLQTRIINPLDIEKIAALRDTNARFCLDESEQPSTYKDYLDELGAAAAKAAKLCNKILNQLDIASGLTLASEKKGDTPESLVCDALNEMARVNDDVAKLVQERVDLLARWCATVANREIAYASAGNVTDFDPSELVSAIAVGVRTRRLSTPNQLSDAISKTLVGGQRDGSWRMGHPFYSPDGDHVVRAPSADLVWTLASALSHFPQITVADGALLSYVDWLERTQRVIQRPGVLKAEALAEDEGRVPAVGWPADRLRQHDRIHLATTAYAVNALLAVRDLLEHRLWELCQERFTVFETGLRLKDMDPVDLLMPHTNRLHSQLARMVRATHRAEKDATYSIVLHGPPGSSKTTVATALSQAIWKGSGRWGQHGQRLVRVTPADFTRGGEDRVDSEAQFIFRLLQHLRGVTILFDEIDDLLRRRSSGAKERTRFMDLVTPAMLNRLQDLRDVCERQEICFLFGTNYVERIEPALMRDGRIDLKVPVTYPDYESRLAIAEQHLGLLDEPPAELREEDRDRWKEALMDVSGWIAQKTAGKPWSVVRAAAKNAGEALKAVIESTKRWEDPSTIETVRRELGRRADTMVRQDDPPGDPGLDWELLDRLRLESPLHREVLYQLISAQEAPGGLNQKVEAAIHQLCGVGRDGQGDPVKHEGQPDHLTHLERRKIMDALLHEMKEHPLWKTAEAVDGAGAGA
jgi:hypothetical protein